jgi:hypothetical protein
MLLTKTEPPVMIRSHQTRRIRLVVQDAALSRRRSRVRLPYALPHTIFAPHHRLKPRYKRLEPMCDGQGDALYSNRTATVIRGSSGPLRSTPLRKDGKTCFVLHPSLLSRACSHPPDPGSGSQVTHKEAQGMASRRFSGIGCPQLLQIPYVSLSISPFTPSASSPRS